MTHHLCKCVTFPHFQFECENKMKNDFIKVGSVLCPIPIISIPTS